VLNSWSLATVNAEVSSIERDIEVSVLKQNLFVNSEVTEGSGAGEPTRNWKRMH